MTKLYQVILNISDYEYNSITPVFNSLDLNKAIGFAFNLVYDKYLVDNIYNLSEFHSFDRDFFQNCNVSIMRDFMQNIYIIETDLDTEIQDINFHHTSNNIVWKITKDVAKSIFIKKVIKAYKDNQFFISEEDAEKLFFKIVKSPKDFYQNNDSIDADANSDDNITHIHYFEKFEKN